MKTSIQDNFEGIPVETRLDIRRRLQSQLHDVGDRLRKVVVFLRPILDPDLGRGWRCTLHGFPRQGDLAVATATGFDPPATALLAAVRLANSLREAPVTPRPRSRRLAGA